MPGGDPEPLEGEIGIGLLDRGGERRDDGGEPAGGHHPRRRCHRATPRGSAARSRPPRPLSRRGRRPEYTPRCADRSPVRGALSSVAGSLAVRRVSWSAAVRRPGMITPPMKRASAVTQSNVVAVPKSTTIVSAPVELDGGEDVDDAVGAHGERLVHVQPHRQRGAGVDRDAGAAGDRGDPLDHALGDRRRHRREAHGRAPRWASARPGSGSRRARCPTRPGVRSGLVVSRQCASSASPWKRPAVISVLPMSRVRSMARSYGVRGRLGQLDGARPDRRTVSAVGSTRAAHRPRRCPSARPATGRADAPAPEPVARTRARASSACVEPVAGGVQRSKSCDHGGSSASGVDIRQARRPSASRRRRAPRESHCVTLMPMPTATQARASPCQRASQRIPPSFRSSSIRSLGHLSREREAPIRAASSASATARPTRRLRSSTAAGGAGRSRALSQRPPGGDRQPGHASLARRSARRRRPRCPPPRPSAASWCSTSMVELDRGRTACSLGPALSVASHSRKAPNTIRYQANAAKLWCDT